MYAQDGPAGIVRLFINWKLRVEMIVKCNIFSTFFPYCILRVWDIH